MLERSDLRLAPAAGALWILAAVGVHGGSARLLVVLAGGVALLLLVGLLSRRPALLPLLLAHLGIVVLGLVLLLPALGRHELAAGTLQEAAAEGLVVEVQLEAIGDAQAPASGPAWSRDAIRLRASTVPGSARIGREQRSLGAVQVLVQASGEAAAQLAEVRAGDRLQVRAGVRTGGDLIILTPTRITAQSGGATWRTHLRDRARAATDHLPADEAALVRGMTTGDTAGLGESTEEIMRRAGISHLVAVSGANIAFLLAAVLIPLLVLGVPRRPRILLAAVVAGGYVSLVGPEASVLRAATMAAPLLLARFVGMRGSPVSALALTLALWSALDPVTAASIGFVLSALATAAILLLAPPLARAIVAMSGERVGEGIALVLAVPIVAQAACTPVLVLLAPEVSAWAVAVNVVVGPIVGPTTVIGVVAVVVGAVSLPAAAALYDLAAGGAHLVLLIATTADALPGSRIGVPEGAAGAIGAVLVLLAATLAIIGRRRRWVRFAVAAVVVASLAPPLALRLPLPLPGARAQPWIIAACAVGQGDAVLLRPAGSDATILVDTGPEPQPLAACLDLLGVDRIDLLVLTHPHADHVGGRAALTGSRTPAAQWICPLPEAAAQTLPAVPALAVTTGERWSTDGLDLEVLWPADEAGAREASARETGGGEDDDANDCSVVIAATWADGTRYVGLGDLEPVAQGRLAALGPGSADVVKIAHHGSARQDPELYTALDPEAVLVTVGAENSFGHPTEAALGMARSLTPHLGRTDVHGTVLVPRGDVTDLRSVGAAR